MMITIVQSFVKNGKVNMRILLATLAFSNPDLLELCLNSWHNHVPRINTVKNTIVDRGVLWQGRNQEMAGLLPRARALN